jgi:hypothetical protein
MPALTPTNPEEVMVIRKINQFITTLSVPFWRFGRLRVGGRGTLVKMQSGAVAVFSPVALTPEVKEVVSGMGELKYIAAPDIEHHIFLGPWYEAYPNAKVIGPEGLPEKRDKQKNEKVPFAVVLTKENRDNIKIDPEFDAEFDVHYVASHMNKEIAFLHKPSKTLIEADLMFNLPATEQFSKTGQSANAGFLTKIFIALNGTSGTAMGQKRFLWYAISSGDRPGFNVSIAKINKWDFDTIVPCHGDVIETGGKGIFQKVFDWHLASMDKDAKKTA